MSAGADLDLTRARQGALALPGVLTVERDERDPQDRYYTPRWCVDLVLGHDDPRLSIAIATGASQGVLEPSERRGSRGTRRMFSCSRGDRLTTGLARGTQLRTPSPPRGCSGGLGAQGAAPAG